MTTAAAASTPPLGSLRGLAILSYACVASLNESLAVVYKQSLGIMLVCVLYEHVKSCKEATLCRSLSSNMDSIDHMHNVQLQCSV